VVSNPEFLKEGNAIHDFCNPDRIVLGHIENEKIGGLTGSEQTIIRFRRDIYDGNVSHNKFITMSNRSAELAKYASNAMLATRISFMNEMSRICDHVGADIDDIKAAVGSDSRIGPAFLNAGPGWGGSCFPKDLAALSNIDDGIAPLVCAAIRTNDVQKAWIASRAEHLARTFLGGSGGGDLTRPSVCVWGVAFKPDTDDVRESPALDIIRSLLILGCDVVYHDPIAFLPRSMNIERHECKYDAARDAELVLVLTDWDEYKKADWAGIAKSDAPPIIFDARNCLDRTEVEKHLRLHRL
jgi:UDPglucose 6-dehydrogenase